MFVAWFTYVVWLDMVRDDDDNWFSDAKKRLKRWWRARRMVPQPVLVGGR